MPHTTVTTVEALGIDAVQLPHAQRQVALRRFDKQMIVIVHQAIRVTQPAKSHYHFAEADKKQLSVSIIEKYRILRVTAGGNVIGCIWKLKSEGAGHTRRLCYQNRYVKT